ncbi:RNase adapter RapZ [soil metagenome]
MTLAEPRDVDVTVISGLSGAGRSQAAKVLEDLGWYVIDNLPPALIDQMLGLALAPGNDLTRVAFVVDARGGIFFEEAAQALDDLRANVREFRLIYLEASEEALVRRFEALRRRHPLAEGERVIEGIRRERRLMQPLRAISDLTIDTSELSVHGLRELIAAGFGGDSAAGLKSTIMSFGYKFGLPRDASMVLDVRFLPNPHWVDDLRPLTGLDEPVRDYVMKEEATTRFLVKVRDLMATVVPAFEQDGRHYLTVCIGCTGGRHRSVVLAEALGAWWREQGYSVSVIHRDLERLPLQ